MSPFSKCGCSSFLSLTAVSRASAGFQAPLVPILDSFVQWTACANCARCLVYIYIYLPGTGDKHLSYNKFSSVSQLCPTLSTPWIAAHQASLSIYQLPEFTQTHAHRVGDAIQPSHPLSSPSPPAPNPSEHQGLFQWVNSAWGGQSIGVSASTSVLPVNTQNWSFRMDWLDLLAVQGALKSLLQHHSSKASIFWHSAVPTVQQVRITEIYSHSSGGQMFKIKVLAGLSGQSHALS